MSAQKLTISQIRFCKNYIENGGNGVEAVLNAGYKVKNNARDVASVIAYENLRKPHIKDYMKELYSASGLDQSEVEYEHAYLIRQRNDLPVKAKAIEMYYKVNGKYTTGIGVVNDSELNKAINKISELLPD